MSYMVPNYTLWEGTVGLWVVTLGLWKVTLVLWEVTEPFGRSIGACGR